MQRSIAIFLVSLALIIGGLFAWNLLSDEGGFPLGEEPALVVLSYSNFLKTWGPAQELTRDFEKSAGLKIKWIELGNAGMILENLKGRTSEDMPDLVIGLDSLSLHEARDLMQWKKITTPGVVFSKELPAQVVQSDFVPVDWAPMTFIFKRAGQPAPARLDDLLGDGYANSLALQDPRTSSTGLYFMMWVLSLKGEDMGFDFLGKLKPSVRIVSPSWSASYSLFQNNQAPMVFSFFTSTIYHYLNEGDYKYQPIYFDEPHVFAAEYMGVPAGCRNCAAAEKFARFLLTRASQKIIMEKNFMLPVVENVKQGTPFDFPRSIELINPETYAPYLQKKEELLQRWTSLNL